MYKYGSTLKPKLGFRQRHRRSSVFLGSAILCWLLWSCVQWSREYSTSSPPAAKTASAISSHEVDPTKGKDHDPAVAHLTPDKFPVLQGDVAYIVRTGFEVRARLKAGLETWIKDEDPKQVVIFSDRQGRDGKFNVQDAIKQVSLWKDQIKTNGRFEYYRNIQRLPKDHGSDGNRFDRRDGWAFDAVKQVAALYLGVQQLRQRNSFKWFIVVDDDTYIHRPSLLKVLSGYDSKRASVLGNAWVTDQEEYMHGGSGIVVSAGAVAKLFEKPGLVEEMLGTALAASDGDRHISKYLKLAGAALEKKPIHSFNHEGISSTLIKADWYCSWIASWHHINAETMMWTHNMMQLTGGDGPVKLCDLVHAHPDAMDDSLWSRENHDYMMCRDNAHYSEDCKELDAKAAGVQKLDAGTCQQACVNGTIMTDCAAWTYKSDGKCVLSPGFMLTSWESKGRTSGVNKALLAEWRKNCGGPHA